MKQFLKRSIYSLISLFVISFLLTNIKFSDEFIISKTKGTNFDKVAWNLNLINNEPERFKDAVIFLGPSLFLNGINDSLLEVKGVKSLNLAVNHRGNEVMLFFANKIKHLAPKKMILFKDHNLVLRTHKLSPLLFKSSEIYNYGQGLNFYFFQHIFKRLKFVYEYFLFNLFSIGDFNYTTNSKYGVRLKNNICDDFKEIKETSFQLDETINLYQNNYRYTYEKESNSWVINSKSIKREILDYFWFQTNIYNAKSQKVFIDEIKTFTKTKNIQCEMLYVPQVKDVDLKYNYNRNSYRKDSNDLPVFILNDFTAFNDSNLWADFQHLNRNGAELFIEKLIDCNYIDSLHNRID